MRSFNDPMSLVESTVIWKWNSKDRVMQLFANEIYGIFGNTIFVEVFKNHFSGLKKFIVKIRLWLEDCKPI